MKLRLFGSREQMTEAGFNLVSDLIQKARGGSTAVMLTGGNTVKDLYSRVAQSDLNAHPDLSVILSDERHVPVDSPESNYGAMRSMLKALAIDDAHVLRVKTELSLKAAADDYDSRISEYLEKGGNICFALLGLGADGHIASLFSSADLASGDDRFAIEVARNNGPDRVSVTAGLLGMIGRIVLYVQGKEKRETVDRVINGDNSLIAVKVINMVGDTELWYSE